MFVSISVSTLRDVQNLPCEAVQFKIDVFLLNVYKDLRRLHDFLSFWSVGVLLILSFLVTHLSSETHMHVIFAYAIKPSRMLLYCMPRSIPTYLPNEPFVYTLCHSRTFNSECIHMLLYYRYAHKIFSL